MMIFKNMSIAISTSIICASLFFGDVEASKPQDEIKQYVDCLFSKHENLNQTYSEINNAVTNIKQIATQRFDKAQIDEKFDSIIKLDNSSLYILSKYRLNRNEYLIDKLSELQEKTDTANKINILTKKMIVSLGKSGKDPYSLHNIPTDVVNALNVLRSDDKFIQIIKQTGKFDVWKNFHNANLANNMSQILSICYDTCHGNASEIIKLFLGDDETTFGNKNRNEVIESFSSTKAKIIENVQGAFIYHIAKHFLRNTDLTLQTYDEFNATNFFSTEEEKLKTHGFCYITNGDFCDGNKYLAIRNLLTHFIENADFSKYIPIVEGNNVIVVSEKNQQTQDDQKNTKTCLTVSPNVLFKEDEQFLVYRTEGKKVNINDIDKQQIINNVIINKIKNNIDVNNQYLKISTVNNTSLNLFFKLTIPAVINQNHVGSLYVIS